MLEKQSIVLSAFVCVCLRVCTHKIEQEAQLPQRQRAMRETAI